MEKIRILFLITDLKKGGAERYLIDLCNYLQKDNGFEFVIGNLLGGNEFTEETKNFNVVDLKYVPFSFIRKSENQTYKSILNSFKPHIVHTHRFLAEFLSSYYADKNVVYICHGHDNIVQMDNLNLSFKLSRQRIQYFLEKQYLIYVKYIFAKTYFIANSNNTFQYFQKVLPQFLQKNIFSINLGFDYKKFSVLHKSLPLDKVKILNVGSFQLKKNQIFIVEIAKELKMRNINFEINLIGSGQQFSNVKNVIDENGLQKQIVLNGVIDDVENWYKSADIYLHTAKYEPFGLVLLEAMAAGLPVVTLDGVGNREIIEEGVNGFMIYEQNPKLFADVIEKLLLNTELYKSVSAHAIEYAKSFDIEIKMKEMVDFYRTKVSL